ncbi:transporter [Falsihalocynthiibacter sp. SS001]|uniref:SphA family protein n=1 Tax=Falsihalocynthiibacter sp. SS001 TaxID=3349698 RepID=UPI0036D2BEF1
MKVKNTLKLLLVAMACVALDGVGDDKQAYAGEGGGSVYLQGSFNDFQVGFFGPPGFYFRSDLAYLNSKIDIHPRGGRVSAALEQKVLMNLLKFTYLTDAEFLGGKVGFSAELPVLQADVAGSVTPPIGGGPIFGSASNSGMGDLYLNPLLLNWNVGNHHVIFQPGLNIPIGTYDRDAQINVGRNYWSLDLAAAWTYFEPSNGFEISATGGFLFNAENSDTDYTTGTEFHLDWMIAKHFSETTAIGLNGYAYQQLTDDKGILAGGLTAADFNGFKGSGWGLGPAVTSVVNLGSVPLGVTAKALFDVESKNRMKGNLFMISAALEF